MKDFSVKELVNRELKRKNLKPSDLAKRLGMSHPGACRILRQDTIQVQRLADISHILQYNFFRELARKFPYSEPSYSDTPTDDTLKEQIRELKIENRILKEIIGKMTGH